MGPIDLNLPPPDCDFQTSTSLDPLPSHTNKRRMEVPQNLHSSSAPHAKRQFFPSVERNVMAPPPSPPPSECSLFGVPTGRVEDRFSLSGAVLGSGQFGSVQGCSDLLTGEELACKTLLKTQSQTQVTELRNEVHTMLRAAGHDNIAQLRGVFEEESQVHLVMDLCKGGDLFEEVIRRGKFSEGDAAVLFVEAVRAVSFCHARGVLHRDIKPENLLLTRNLPTGVPLLQSQGPHMKLADFGLAVTMSPTQKLKGTAGSPFYMAPEVLDSDYDLKADVWSLGVVLYILLCGSPPFWGETDNAVFEAIRRGHVDMSSGPWASVSQDAKDLVRCLLEQDPARRPSAYRILTHPWLVRHLSPRAAVRHVRNYVAALPVM